MSLSWLDLLFSYFIIEVIEINMVQYKSIIQYIYLKHHLFNLCKLIAQLIEMLCKHCCHASCLGTFILFSLVINLQIIRNAYSHFFSFPFMIDLQIIGKQKEKKDPHISQISKRSWMIELYCGELGGYDNQSFENPNDMKVVLVVYICMFIFSFFIFGFQ